MATRKESDVRNETGGPGLARRLDWNLLRCFYVLMQEKSFTEAAQKLDLKQPTVSNALRRLEETLGRRLIDRGPRTFEPTIYGEALFRQVEQIFGSIDRLSAIMEEEGGAVSGRVAIAMATHVMSPLIDGVLADFRARHPKASIAITVSSSRNVVESVRARKCALGVCLVRDKAPDLQYTHLFREHFGFFCGPPHRLFGAEGLSLEDLRGEPAVSFDTDQVNDVLQPVALLREQAALDPHPAGVSNNLEEVRRMVVAGLGVAPLPIHVVERDVKDGLLWRLPPYDDPPAIDLYVVANPETQLNRAELEFKRMLLERITATPLAERIYAAKADETGARRRAARRP